MAGYVIDTKRRVKIGLINRFSDNYIFLSIKLHFPLSQGMAFSIEERQTLGIHGLLPARVKTQEEQVYMCKLSIDRYEDPLNKYMYLMGLLVSIITSIF